MANDREIAILISARNVTSEAFRQVQEALKKLEAGAGTAAAGVGAVRQQMSLAERAAGILQSTFGQFTAANLAASALQSLGSEVQHFVAEGLKLRSVEQSFSKLATGAKQDTGEMMAALRTGSRGMVTDLNLMTQANKAMLLGLPVTSQSMGELARTATVLGKAMGQDATKSLDDLITALGRSSPLILDNLGLTVKVSEANEAYAAKVGKTAEQLTEADKKLAFYEAAMESARRKTQELGDQTKTLGELVTTAWTQVGNVVSGAAAQINAGAGAVLTNKVQFLQFLQDITHMPVAAALAAADLREQLKALAKTAGDTAGAAAAAAPLRDYVTELREAGIGSMRLRGEFKEQYDAAVKLGASADEITKRFGLSAFQQKQLAERTKETTQALKDQAEIEKKIFAGMRDFAAADAKREQGLRATTLALLDSVRADSKQLEVFPPLTEAYQKLTFSTERYSDRLPSALQKANDALAKEQRRTRSILEQAEAMLKAEIQKGLDFGERLSSTIIGALQGGGDLGKSVGGFLGAEIGKNLGEKLAKELGGRLGGALGGLVGPLGAIGGQLLGSLVDKMFGHKGRDAVKEFSDSFGGFPALQKKLQDTFDPATANKYWVALTQGIGRNNPQQAKAVIDDVTAAIERQKGALEKTPRSFADASAAAEALGLDINKIGDGINQLRVHDSAEEIAAQWNVLKDAGADMKQVAEGAAPKFQVLIDEALKWGHELPESMREPLQKMVDLGKLTDASGDKLEDLTGIKWAEPLEKSVDRVISKIDQLIDRIAGGLGGALSNLPDINVGVNHTDRGDDETPGHAAGAYIREGHVARVHAGEIIGPVDFMARALARASDLTTGGDRGGAGTVIVQIDSREWVRTMMPAVADEVKRLRLVG